MNILTDNKAPKNDNNNVVYIKSQIELIDFLELAYKKLNWFANPINPKGFIQYWTKWVIDKWPENRYRTYSDFIHDENQHCDLSYIFYELAVDKYNTLMEKDGKHLSNQFINFISWLINEKIDNNLKLEIHHWSSILYKWKTNKNRLACTHEKIFNACEPLIDDFTEYGITLFPEVLSKLGYMPDWRILDIYCGQPRTLHLFKRDFKSWCSHLTLEEIKEKYYAR